MTPVGTNAAVRAVTRSNCFGPDGCNAGHPGYTSTLPLDLHCSPLSNRRSHMLVVALHPFTLTSINLADHTNQPLGPELIDLRTQFGHSGRNLA
jgi:hypothetical protein